MRLINARTFKIEDFIGSGIPSYAILSHTWDIEEVTLQDWQDLSCASLKRGFAKIQGACLQALRDELEYVWVDTNCIDKTSSAELSEAINSMFTWYRNASRCYVYLADIPDTAAQLNEGKIDNDDPFRRSKWFTRGWTLQELLAPHDVVFFSTNWMRIGTKMDLKTPLSQITGVEAKFLSGSVPIWLASVAKRMSWMSKRVTTRIEDIAYCMLGIFEINMPLLYGEGPRAFLRLQEEILKATDDQSMFCWEWNRKIVDDNWASILAPSPAVFEKSGEFWPTAWNDNSDVVPYTITNAGLSIKMPFIQTASPYFVCGVLQVRLEWVHGIDDQELPYNQQVCIPLEKARIHRRLPFPTRPFPLHMAMAGMEKNIHIVSRTRSPESSRGYVSLASERLTLFNLPIVDVGFFLTFQSLENKPLMADVWYSTPGVVFIERQSVLGFSFGGANTDDAFAAGILNVTQADFDMFAIILAIRRRRTVNGTHRFNFYCQVVPRRILAGKRRGSPELFDIIREFGRISVNIMHDIDFSCGGSATVALGNMIHYSSSPEGSRQFVRAAHIVGEDKDISYSLKEDTDSSIPLLISIDGLESFGDSQMHVFN